MKRRRVSSVRASTRSPPAPSPHLHTGKSGTARCPCGHDAITPVSPCKAGPAEEDGVCSAGPRVPAQSACAHRPWSPSDSEHGDCGWCLEPSLHRGAGRAPGGCDVPGDVCKCAWRTRGPRPFSAPAVTESVLPWLSVHSEKGEESCLIGGFNAKGERRNASRRLHFRPAPHKPRCLLQTSGVKLCPKGKSRSGS